MRLDQSRYERGDVLCGKCGEWIKKEDVPNLTYRGEFGRLLHECGFQVRGGGRTSKTTMKKAYQTHKSPYKYKARDGIKNDILLNKDKWEKLIDPT